MSNGSPAVLNVFQFFFGSLDNIGGFSVQSLDLTIFKEILGFFVHLALTSQPSSLKKKVSNSRDKLGLCVDSQMATS